MRKVLSSPAEKQAAKSFYDCLYRYSHQRFYNFVRIPEVSILFQIALAEKNVDEIIKKSSTLSKNKKYYKQCAKRLIKFIES